MKFAEPAHTCPPSGRRVGHVGIWVDTADLPARFSRLICLSSVRPGGGSTLPAERSRWTEAAENRFKSPIAGASLGFGNR
ncbi:Hypothetical protein NTJ_07973 [Nesidiocoris tenuis]|uniref:Uncharacterized protein n=1 Tax=Nesidiocoris tenuis TaxID=355587 RepID=A0ABN7AUG7_9HEMI|nr:Hypothetical protein NTJ_07973 [Nesidiocoris tenuis]